MGIVCARCGYINPDGSIFCAKCGYKLDSASSQQNYAGPQQPYQPDSAQTNRQGYNYQPQQMNQNPFGSYSGQWHYNNYGLIISTTNYVPGYEVSEIIGVVAGITVRSRGLGGNIAAGIRSIFGGEINEYVELAENAREQALMRMAYRAKNLGADAVIQVYFDSNDIAQSMDEIIAYGTAVKLIKKT
ncbi:hypothetical protein CM19_12710 [Candidatus Acidianus copahuensis]|uniref:UPF0145 protein CM19_12710 n=2 Tax=Candidatus Acidianus copahuensis TaxID=1160895 RepID=A0A031LJ60_9CREN|nr:hypothetical protein CM19_12710 [Candidatus Acidianus copahuensis]